MICSTVIGYVCLFLVYTVAHLDFTRRNHGRIVFLGKPRTSALHVGQNVYSVS